MKRLRQDLRYAVSALLLVSAATATISGIVADICDLNDFRPHTVLGYVVAALAMAHTAFELPFLIRYIAHRLQGRPKRKPASQTDAACAASLETARTPPRTGSWAAPTPSMTRRGLLGLLIGSTSGFFLGRATAPAALDHPGDGDLGLVYHAWSRPSAPRLLDAITDWGVRPEATKTYPEAERVQLPSPVAAPALSAFAAIGGRRSVRDYATAPMPLGDLSRLLHLAGGITQPGGSAGLRAAPSAGALYPLETYVIAHTVGDLAPGLYHYTVVDHALERLQSDDLRQACVRLGAMQGFLGEANAVFVLTAVFQRLRWRYHRRGYRYALLEAGHIGQNLYLAATAMGMGACAVGAFLDDGLNDLLQIDGVKEAALYMLSVGRR